MTGGLAVGLQPSPSILIGPEVYGSSVLEAGDFLTRRATPLEVIFGGRFIIAEHFFLGLGAGPGLTNGLGSPALRVLARLGFFPAMPPPDRDGDGIIDAAGRLPRHEGRAHRRPAHERLPARRSDTDRDGILDARTPAPTSPASAPTIPRRTAARREDRDKDGILDADDACPDVPGVSDRRPEDQRLPAADDRDKDGILDNDDACPDAPGVQDRRPQDQRLPADRSRQGRHPRSRRRVPRRAGPAGPRSEEERLPAGAHREAARSDPRAGEVQDRQREILPESDAILDAVPKILKEHAEITKVRVEGHTDNRGGAVYNKRPQRAARGVGGRMAGQARRRQGAPRERRASASSSRSTPTRPKRAGRTTAASSSTSSKPAPPSESAERPQCPS